MATSVLHRDEMQRVATQDWWVGEEEKKAVEGGLLYVHVSTDRFVAESRFAQAHHRVVLRSACALQHARNCGVHCAAHFHLVERTPDAAVKHRCRHEQNRSHDSAVEHERHRRTDKVLPHESGEDSALFLVASDQLKAWTSTTFKGGTAAAL